jgi:hypothetical protein
MNQDPVLTGSGSESGLFSEVGSGSATLLLAIGKIKKLNPKATNSSKNYRRVIS